MSFDSEPNPGPGSDPGSDPRKTGRDFRRLPAARGLAWLITAAALLRQQMWRLLLVALIVQVIMGLTRFPVLGLMIALAIPLFSAGMLQCFHHVRRGLPLSPVVLFSPFADTRIAGRLFLLGGIIALVGVMVISWLLSGVTELRDPELLARLDQGDINAIREIDPAVIRRALIALSIGVGVSGVMGYFSIPLLWFRNIGVGAALGTGFKALVKNWKPFMVLGLVLVALSLPLMLIMGLLVGLSAVSGGLGPIQYLLMVFMVLLIQLLMFGTQYCAFAEIFELPGNMQEAVEVEEPSRPQDDDDQFVA